MHVDKTKCVSFNLSPKLSCFAIMLIHMGEGWVTFPLSAIFPASHFKYSLAREKMVFWGGGIAEYVMESIAGFKHPSHLPVLLAKCPFHLCQLSKSGLETCSCRDNVQFHPVLTYSSFYLSHLMSSELPCFPSEHEPASSKYCLWSHVI